MFNQNSKKQTTLSFVVKPSAAVARTTSKAASTVRSSPYERPTATTASATSTKSSYFPSSYNAAAAPSHKSYSAASKSYSAASKSYSAASKSYSAASNSYGSMQAQSASAKTTSKPAKEKAARRVLGTTAVQPTTSVKLSDRQREAFDMALNQGQNMFITGSAGTGKSVLLREVIQAFRGQLRMDENSVVTTASTGIAAFHIGGKTIHSFAGVGYGKGTKESLLTFVKKSRFAVERWMQAQVLIIDEISMLDAALFDALEYIAREVRKVHQFFGGIQLILTGDFYQLPPVEKSGAGRFAFESDAWRSGIKQTVVLTHVFRQKDMRFVDMLNEMRLGSLSDHTVNAFRQLTRVPAYPNDGIQPTELYALRSQVDDANRRRLQSLSGKSYMFNAYDDHDPRKKFVKERPPVPEDIITKIDSWCMAPRQVELKQYAQVMLIKNMPEHNLVNGSRGVVTGFKMIGAREYPVIRFTKGKELELTPETWEVDMGREKYTRTQLPVILAWALSIHKSQGQTIDRLIVDVGKIFEKGQAYVALSRAVGLDALQVMNFAPQCVMAHPRVIQFYAELSRKL